jgi:FKBP-type peptidyl-prolyl cis-trans isomerase
MSLDLEFLEINAKKEGVKTTASGLQYKVLQEGSGEQPVASSTVEVHYEGSLVTGDVFDSSYERGKTISFPLKSVIPGWTEGLQLMKIGSIYELCIPYWISSSNSS